MLTVTNSNDGKIYLVSVESVLNFILLLIIDEEDEELVEKYELSTVKEIFQTILKYKVIIKAVFMNVDMLRTSEYKNSLEASKAIKDFLDGHSIPSHFYTTRYGMATKTLVAANITPYINDYIFVAHMEKDRILCGFYHFTINGNKSFGNECNKTDNLETVADCYAKILTKNYIKKLLLFTADERMTDSIKNFEKLLRTNKTIDEKLVVVDYQKIIESAIKAVLEMSKWFFDRSYIKFYIIPQIPQPIEIWGVIGDSRKLLVAVDCGDPIPFTKSIIFNKSVQTCLMIRHMNPTDKELIQTIQTEQQCHQQKLTFTIESEYFPEIKIEPIIFPEIECLRKKLDELETKIPVIGFFRNSSVICVYRKNGYQFLDSWNGLYGNELFINFEEEKPKFGMSAIKANETKMSFVVYDLIKIMSMPADNITVNESWKFEFTKDENNPLLLEFDNFDGTKKAASPAFLMAILLKEKIKLIKNEMKMKEKPEEIGFCFFDKLSDDEKKRIESGLEEACEMLKIKCKFFAL